MADDQFIWQERGTSWKGVAIYHVTTSAVVRNQRKAAFGELKWRIADDQVTDAYVEWSELGHRLWHRRV